MISRPPVLQFDPSTGVCSGTLVQHYTKRLGEIVSLFAQGHLIHDSHRESEVTYQVSSYNHYTDDTSPQLSFGVSSLYPGKVGNEYFMTRGHYHAVIERPEVYWGISGYGILLLMSEGGECWAEYVFPGSVHPISGRIAHRLCNTGDTVMSVGAVWPVDAGHNYSALDERAFPYRVVCKEGEPMLVPREP